MCTRVLALYLCYFFLSCVHVYLCPRSILFRAMCVTLSLSLLVCFPLSVPISSFQSVPVCVCVPRCVYAQTNIDARHEA